jgi:uncharacterized protein YndB with AHSA1/START domain
MEDGSAVRVDRASRLIAAPRDRVYKAFVEPEAIVQWLPPSGARAALEEFDPRPGGPFRITLIFDEGSQTKRKTSENSDTVDGTFVDLVPPEFIEQQFTFVSDDPQFAGTMVMTWTLTEGPQGTLVSVAAQNVPEGITRQEHRAGVISSLANLAAYIETGECSRLP